MSSLFGGGIYGGGGGGGIYGGGFGSTIISPSPSAAAFASLTPAQRAIVLQKFTQTKLGQPAPHPSHGGLFGWLHPVAHVITQATGEIASSLESTPQSLYTLARAVAADDINAYSQASRLWGGHPGRFHYQVGDLALQQGKQIVSDFSHPLRHPGYTLMDVLSIISLGKVGAARIAGAMREVGALRAAARPLPPEDPLAGEPLGPSPTEPSGNVGVPAPVGASERVAAEADHQRVLRQAVDALIQPSPYHSGFDMEAQLHAQAEKGGPGPSPFRPPPPPELPVGTPSTHPLTASGQAFALRKALARMHVSQYEKNTQPFDVTQSKAQVPGQLTMMPEVTKASEILSNPENFTDEVKAWAQQVYDQLTPNQVAAMKESFGLKFPEVTNEVAPIYAGAESGIGQYERLGVSGAGSEGSPAFPTGEIPASRVTAARALHIPSAVRAELATESPEAIRAQIPNPDYVTAPESRAFAKAGEVAAEQRHGEGHPLVGSRTGIEIRSYQERTPTIPGHAAISPEMSVKAPGYAEAIFGTDTRRWAVVDNGRVIEKGLASAKEATQVAHETYMSRELQRFTGPLLGGERAALGKGLEEPAAPGTTAEQPPTERAPAVSDLTWAEQLAQARTKLEQEGPSQAAVNEISKSAGPGKRVPTAGTATQSALEQMGGTVEHQGVQEVLPSRQPRGGGMVTRTTDEATARGLREQELNPRRMGTNARNLKHALQERVQQLAATGADANTIEAFVKSLPKPEKITTQLSKEMQPHFEKAFSEGKAFPHRNTYVAVASRFIGKESAAAIYDDATKFYAAQQAKLTPAHLESAGMNQTEARETFNRVKTDIRKLFNASEKSGKKMLQRDIKAVMDKHIPKAQSNAIYKSLRTVKGGADLTANDYLKAIYRGLTVKPYAVNRFVAVRDNQTNRILSTGEIKKLMGISKLPKDTLDRFNLTSNFFHQTGEGQMTLGGEAPVADLATRSKMSSAAEHAQATARRGKQEYPATGRYHVTTEEIMASRNPVYRALQRTMLGLSQKFPDSHLAGMGKTLDRQISFEHEQVARLVKDIEMNLRANKLPTSEGEMQALFKAGKAQGREPWQVLKDLADSTNLFAQIGLLFLKPAYWTANTLGQISLTLADHALNPVSVARASAMEKMVISPKMAARYGMDAATFHDEALTRLRGAMQIQAGGMAGLDAQEFSQGTILGSVTPDTARFSHLSAANPMTAVRKLHRGLGTASEKVLDEYYRRNAFLHEAWRQGYRTPENVADLLMGKLGNDKLIQVARHANKNIIDYGRLSKTEKNVVKRIIFFYPWLKAATLYAPHFFAEHPFQALVLTNMAQEEQKQNLRELGPMPSFMPGVFKIGERNVPGIGKQPVIFNPMAETVLGVGGQTLQTAQQLAMGNMSAANDPTQSLTPLVSAVVAGLTHKDLFTGRDLPAGENFFKIVAHQLAPDLPFKRLQINVTRANDITKGKINPAQQKILFPYSQGEAYGRFLGPGLSDVVGALGGGTSTAGGYAINTQEARSRYFAEQKASASNKQQRVTLNENDYLRKYTEAGQKTGVFTSAPKELKQAFSLQAEQQSNRQVWADRFGVRSSGSIPPLIELGSDLDVLTRRGIFKQAEAENLLNSVKAYPDQKLRDLVSNLSRMYFGSQTISAYKALFKRLGVALTVP